MQRETIEQINLIRWADMESGKHPELKLLFHIPNGGSRNKAEAVRLKAAGVKSGVPDLFLPYPHNGYNGLFIELKYGKNRPSENQKVWIEALNNNGYKALVCWGMEGAIDAIKEYIR